MFFRVWFLSSIFFNLLKNIEKSLLSIFTKLLTNIYLSSVCYCITIWDRPKSQIVKDSSHDLWILGVYLLELPNIVTLCTPLCTFFIHATGGWFQPLAAWRIGLQYDFEYVRRFSFNVIWILLIEYLSKFKNSIFACMDLDDGPRWWTTMMDHSLHTATIKNEPLLCQMMAVYPN